MVKLSLRLPVQSEAAAAARHCIESLGGLVGVATLENVKLLVSELVTNSLRHAGLRDEDCVEVEVCADDEYIRVEVKDPGPGFEIQTAKAPRRDQTHGWGLYLVDQLAQRWGVSQQAGHTDVWFEVPRRHGALEQQS